MGLEQKYEVVERNQKWAEENGPLSEEVQRKLDYRFRLDWNYHSLTMEGNRFTRAETQSIMSGLVTVMQKTVQDVQEMIGHDEVVQNVVKMATQELPLSEKRIKALHKAIVFEEVAEKRSQIGQYKKDENFAYNYRNERSDFLASADVPDALHRLVDKVNAELELHRKKRTGVSHLLKTAFDFHADFLYIHPFHDGNGRLSRILLNIVLISAGFPPLVVKRDEREVYGRLLTDIQFYNSSREAYYEFMTDLVIRSQELLAKAIRGESLEEAGDIDMRMELLKRRMELMGKESEVQIEYSKDVFVDALNTWVKRLAEEINRLREKFLELFMEVRIQVVGQAGPFSSGKKYSIQSFTKDMIELVKVGDRNYDLVQPPIQIRLEYRALKHVKRAPFHLSIQLLVSFSQYEFSVGASIPRFPIVTRLYHQGLSDGEISEILAALGDHVLNEIEAYLGKK